MIQYKSSSFLKHPWRSSSIYRRIQVYYEGDELTAREKAERSVGQLPQLRDIDTLNDINKLKPGLRAIRTVEKRKDQVWVSVIIPVYNEASGLKNFLEKLKSVLDEESHGRIPYELMVIDGGSTDNTVSIAKASGVQCEHSPRKGRASQMNYGANLASGNILYFLHADTIPPKYVLHQIVTEVKRGASSGCFRLSFDEPSPVMRAYAWFTRLDFLPFRFGDQSLFITSDRFHELRGFREDHIVMEDNEFIRRLRRKGSFVIVNDAVITSARKYRENGFFRLQFIFTLMFFMYYLGARQETLLAFYRDMVINSKL